MPIPVLLAALAVAVSAALAIRAAYRGEPRGVRLFKPLTTILVLATTLLVFTPADPRYRTLILAGLALSLGGDVFLMLGPSRFLPGLGCFLAAQLVYAWAFTTSAPGGGGPLWLATPFAFFAVIVVLALWKGLPGLTLRGAVVVYAAAIALMAWRAAARAGAPGVTPASGAAALAGACLFLASDAVLAVNRFRQPFRLGESVTLATYWAAQFLIALSVQGHG
jgi:uncharacterized membrane protein YhhN